MKGFYKISGTLFTERRCLDFKIYQLIQTDLFSVLLNPRIRSSSSFATACVAPLCTHDR